jgi:pimeloyl-ACP methyl ester carboxylesterase
MEAITFAVEGQSIAGVMHEPLGNQGEGLCVVMLSGPGTTRSGPHDLFVRMACRLAAHGIPCVRFDYRGRGESDGIDADLTVDTMFEDAKACCQHILGVRPETRSFILVGMCMGAIAAIKLLDTIPRVHGGVLLGAPQYEPTQALVDWARHTWHMIGLYARKSLQVVNWWRCLRGHVDYGTVARAIWGQKHKYHPLRIELGVASAADEPFAMNKKFLLLLYGRYDPIVLGSVPYYEQFLRTRGWRGAVAMIDHGSRTFEGYIASQNVIASVCEYIQHEARVVAKRVIRQCPDQRPRIRPPVAGKE